MKELQWIFKEKILAIRREPVTANIENLLQNSTDPTNPILG